MSLNHLEKNRLKNNLIKYIDNDSTAKLENKKGYYANTEIFPERKPRKRPKGLGKLYDKSLD